MLVGVDKQDGHTPAASSPHAGKRLYVPRHMLSPEARERKRDSVRRAMQKLLSTPEGRAIHAGRARRHREKYPEKHHARHVLNHAIAAGKVSPQPCAECGEHETEAHHPDYLKPLDVVWLCKNCHESK